MKRFLLIAVTLLGCDYYGPKNPPPDTHADPKYTLRTGVFRSTQNVDGVTCPAGSLPTGGGCDCAGCGPAGGTAILFGCVPTGDGWVSGCYGGCTNIYVTCESTSKPGTIVQGLLAPSPETMAVVEKLQAHADEFNAR